MEPNGRQFLLGSFGGEDEETNKPSCIGLLISKINNTLNDVQDFLCRAWEMGRSEPRKVIFAIKMGLTLAIVSLLMFWKGVFYEDVTQYSIWAILTVIVMFEFTIGATFIKGFNRILGTLFAGALAFCFAQLSLLAGRWENIVIVTSIFVTGFCASYLKLYPTMKPYEYGYRVFILTYCILMVAGNRTREYTEAVITRLVLIAIGASVCLVVNVFVYPIWAGDALHGLVVKNFKDVATSLEGCVTGYLKSVEYEKVPSGILSFQPYDDPLYNGYRSVLESTSKEDTLLGFAIWEPPHGRFRMFKYPWKDYAKVTGALRHCAFMVMALHGCLLSEIQAPPEKRQVFRYELQRVGEEGAKVLQEIGSRMDRMERLGSADILQEVHEAAEKLQKKIDQKSYLLVNSEGWQIAKQSNSLQSPDIDLDRKEDDIAQLGSKSISETILDIGFLPVSTPPRRVIESSDNPRRRQSFSWPSRTSVNADEGSREVECRTFESASALSLATFASLLIEFVARLQNVVDSFEELSDNAEFMEPMSYSLVTGKRRDGLLINLLRCFGF